MLIIMVNTMMICLIYNVETMYSSGKLKSIFSYLREYDLKSKGLDRGAASEGELLKELVFKILH